MVFYINDFQRTLHFSISLCEMRIITNFDYIAIACKIFNFLFFVFGYFFVWDAHYN